MAAVELNIENMEQGATVDDTVIPPLAIRNEDGSTFDLSGWTARAQIRKKYTDIDPVKIFTIVVTTVTGLLQLSLTAAETAAIAAGDYVYDVEIEKAGVVRRIAQGKITVSPEVTK